MIEMFGFQLGTVFQGGTLVGVIVIIAGLITVWIKGIPARLLAKNAGDATLRGEEKGLREFFRAEFTKCNEKLKELERQHKQDIEDSDRRHTSALKQRDDRIFQLEVLSAMLLRRLLISDPDDNLVKDAKAVLELNIGFPVDAMAIEAAIKRLKGNAAEAPKSSTLQAAEHAVSAAKATVEKAETTVVEVTVDEKVKGNGK